MTDPDVIVDLADRTRAKQQRGEDWQFEFEIDYASLTDAEQEQFLALMKARHAHSQEKLEAIEEAHRIGLAIRELLESKGAWGLSLWEAGQAGYITVLEVIESIRVWCPTR